MRQEPEESLEVWPSGQRQQTVNLSGIPYVGSNPATSTILPFSSEAASATRREAGLATRRCAALELRLQLAGLDLGSECWVPSTGTRVSERLR